MVMLWGITCLLILLAIAGGVGYCTIRWWKGMYTLTLALICEWVLWSAAIPVWFGGQHI